ncbi:MAG TPA: hypothetical protein ENG67_06735 [candidate division WOR-3 bacterium]|uniref:Uncharacterized protein n=1 Tax=candidate division WOR-3 bacterium TaxID=2052148 RepID=A0A7C1BEV2_UNCW3|nr:hypothetical protein [candidate division WOR-3 bacterium]
MSAKHALFVAFILLSCSLPFGVIDRALSDYFPLETGNYWNYVTQDGDTISARIEGDTVILGDTAFIYTFGSDLYYFFKADNGIDRYYYFVTYRGGDKVVLEKRIGSYLSLPLIDGYARTDSFSNTVVVVNDTFQCFHTVDLRISLVGDLSVGDRTFHEVYSAEITDSRRVDSPLGTSASERHEVLCLAPDVGIIRKQEVLAENGDTVAYSAELIGSNLLGE